MRNVPFILDARFGRVMRRVSLALRGWRWCLVGGRAVEIWRNPPQTPDVDVLADISDEDAGEAVRRLRRLGIQPLQVFTGLGTPLVFLEDRKERVDIDLLGAYDPTHHLAISRAVVVPVQGVRIPVATPEDVIVLKAQAAIDPGRDRGKRIRDRRAIAALAARPSLDRDYIAYTLRAHGWTEEARLLKSMGVI